MGDIKFGSGVLFEGTASKLNGITFVGFPGQSQEKVETELDYEKLRQKEEKEMRKIRKEIKRMMESSI